MTANEYGISLGVMNSSKIDCEGGAWLALLAQKLREGPPEAGTSERHTRLIPERLEKARAWN